MNTYLQVFTTVDDPARARELAQGLIDAHLAGCVQILGPMESTYWWQGKRETAREYLLLIKTRSDLYPQLEAWLKEHHPYDVPEILAVPVSAGLPAYLQWLDQSLHPPKPTV